MIRALFPLAAAFFCLASPLGAAPPDLTKGGTVPDGATHDWNLGATGARGWMHSERLTTSDARQILITAVDAGSPAADVLRAGDVLLGFDGDARMAFGQALTAAETGDGVLSLTRWRDGQMAKVEVRLPVLGKYGATAPFASPKSKLVLEQGCDAIARGLRDPKGARQNAITRSLNGLALLASGDPKYLPLVKAEAEWAAGYSAESFQTWWYGYVLTFLSEYVMATGDDAVLPGLRRLALESANGQSIVGSWGHTFAGKDGRLIGYGMMNSPGIPLTIGLVLAREAGVKDPEIERAIGRSVKLLRFYVGKGAIPYGDHDPWIQTHEDNGKCGMAAVLFNLLGDAEAATYFSRMALASHGAERDTGHTGNFFNMLWAMPAVAQLGPEASGAWMREFGGWYFDLGRRPDGTFAHLGPPEPKPDSYKGWDATGGYMLALAAPLKKLRITGRDGDVVADLNAAEAAAVIADGRGWSNLDRNSAYDALSTEQLLGRLASWSPVVRERAGMALGRRKDADVAAKLVALLESKPLHARYGACQALKAQGGRGAGAVDALLVAFGDDDLWLRILAAEALAGIGDPARGAAPEMLARLAKGASKDDPRGMEQRYLSFALFNQRGGLLARSIEGIDRDALFTSVRAGLQNEDGRARGSYASVFGKLSYEQLQPLLPAIHRAIVEPAPSGIMFADNIRVSGLELFAKYRIDEGIELLADYARNQKKHGSQKRVVEVLKLLQGYGAHAQRVIPHLEETADYFENREEGFPKKLSIEKAKFVRDAIAAIRAATEKPELRRLTL